MTAMQEHSEPARARAHSLRSARLDDSGRPPWLPGTPAPEGVYPGDCRHYVILQHLYRPDVKDIDTYQFTLSQNGRLSIETIAERLTDSSLLDSVISMVHDSNPYPGRPQRRTITAQDSFLEPLRVRPRANILRSVTSTGNTDFDPTIPDSGLGGTTQGRYNLRLNFTSTAAAGLTDTTGTLFDGDADGLAGGQFDFWFRTQTAANTIFVDKTATAGTGALGSITNPYTNISTALAAAGEGKIVRIVGNGGRRRRNINTVADNLTYNIGARHLW